MERLFLDVINEAVLDDKTKKEIIEKYSRPNYKGGLGILLEELCFGYKARVKSNELFTK